MLEHPRIKAELLLKQAEEEIDEIEASLYPVPATVYETSERLNLDLLYVAFWTANA